MSSTTWASAFDRAGQHQDDKAFITFSDAVYTQFEGRRKLRPGDIALAYEWVQDLGRPQEVVLMLLNYCADTRGSNFFLQKRPVPGRHHAGGRGDDA